ncbi:MAG: ABC-F family ATP-binding cassette domain-containing protein [Myxococcota bacterium]
MSLVVCENLSLALGGRTLFDGDSLQVGDHDRIGLIGPNGTGKSSLLRILSGEISADSGQVRRRRHLRVGYLRQEVQAVSGQALLPYVVESVPGRTEVERDLNEAQAEIESAEGRAAGDDRMMELAERIASATERLEHFETQFTPHRAERILMGLGFSPNELSRDVGELSGGWRMRAVLAALLFQQPDLLLLDEPTNHLDMPSVAWFSSFLQRYEGAFVLISHDREFLNEQIRRVVSLEPEGLRSYEGNFEQYRIQRAEELEVLHARARNLDQKRAQMEKFVERFRAKASKAKQAQSRLKQLEKMDRVDLPEDRRTIRFRFPAIKPSGKEVLRVEGLRKAYGDNVVLDGVDLRVDRGDRIAIIGKNGAGKTTLLRLLSRELSKDGGEVTWGYRTKVGYYAQHHAEVLNPTQTVNDAVWERVQEGNATLVRGALGALMMGDQDVEKRIGVLSGGERARVALARLLVDPGNVLLMDEPTNHLDLESSEALVDALQGFEGTLLFVSHNRRFLRALATKIWNVEDGHVDVYPGSLDDYLDVTSEREATPEASEPAAPTKRATRQEAKGRKREEAKVRQTRKRVLGPLEKRVAELEKKIATLEAEKARQTEALGDPALYDDPARREEMTKAFQHTDAELDVLTQTWMEAQEELEARTRELESGSG